MWRRKNYALVKVKNKIKKRFSSRRERESFILKINDKKYEGTSGCYCFGVINFNNSFCALLVCVCSAITPHLQRKEIANSQCFCERTQHLLCNERKYALRPDKQLGEFV